jgi:hypothetical protein
MKPDELKIGYWYKLRSEIVKLTEICGRGVICTSNGINGTGMKLTHVHNLNPATLDDLAVTLGGVKCWFVWGYYNDGITQRVELCHKNDEISAWAIDMTASAGIGNLNIALALAAAVNAPPITREQWKELTDD